MDAFPLDGIDFSDEATASLRELSKTQYDYIINSVAFFYVNVVDLHGDQKLEGFSANDKAIVLRFFEGFNGESLWVRVAGFLVELRRRRRWGLRVARVILPPTIH
jgi:hypothetical protein